MGTLVHRAGLGGTEGGAASQQGATAEAARAVEVEMAMVVAAAAAADWGSAAAAAAVNRWVAAETAMAAAGLLRPTYRRSHCSPCSSRSY